MLAYRRNTRSGLLDHTHGGCDTDRRRRAKSGPGHDEDLRQHAHGRSSTDARTLLGFQDYFADLEASADRAAAAISEAEKSVPYLVPELSEFEYAFCFGAGTAYAAALEGALKMKEMPLLHAEGSETWEMASGPSTMVDERALCVAFYNGSEGDESTAAVARHARDWGARVVDIGPDAPADDMHLRVNVPQNEAFASLALVAPLYLLAYRVARARDIDPEKPHWRERYHVQGMTHIVGG